ncbi:hypothetical protein BDM02DRAFT_3092878 [Thelephora ganbajun]|uniref:Uncharacterized protein n=1 Tax=Thelephora ganbajun TaxID=370292 RepID=A0ACB6ZMB8_THEGA|nr:hypothetical protein BDM02DRAFT_3092878 [Thelephora ganbajun]
MSHEQVVHDRINLYRLLRRLEKSVAEEGWHNPGDLKDSEPFPHAVWIRTQGTLGKIKHARSLLKNVELESQIRERDFDYNDVRNRLSTLENVVSEVNKKWTPTPRRPPPILPLMPQLVDEPENVTPEPPPPPYEEGQKLNNKFEDSIPPELTLPSSEESPITDDLLTAPSEKLPPSTSSSRRVPLSTAAVHEELSAQLAQMATQLKRNAIHFSDTLVRDQAVVEETKLTMESNFDSMQKERTRLRDHTGKSRGTTWLTLFSVIAVFVSFFIMFFIIRLTR